MTTTEPGSAPDANDRATWENDAWGRGVEHGRAEAGNRFAAELKLISTLLSGLKMTADAHQAQMARMQVTMDETAAALGELLQAASGSHKAEPTTDWTSNPVFDSMGREFDPANPVSKLTWPLHSICRCGRQIVQPAPADDWQHSD